MRPLATAAEADRKVHLWSLSLVPSFSANTTERHTCYIYLDLLLLLFYSKLLPSLILLDEAVLEICDTVALRQFPFPIRFSQHLAATRQDGIRMGRETRAMLSNVHCRQEGLGRDYGVHEEYISIRSKVRQAEKCNCILFVYPS